MNNKEELINNLTNIQRKLIDELEELSAEAKSESMDRRIYGYKRHWYNPEDTMKDINKFANDKTDKVLGIEKTNAEANRILALKGNPTSRTTNFNGGEIIKSMSDMEKATAEAGKIEIDAIINGYREKAEMIGGDYSIEDRRDRILKQIMEIDQMIEKLSKEQKLSEIEQVTQDVRMPEIEAETQAIRTGITQEKDNIIEERE